MIYHYLLELLILLFIVNCVFVFFRRYLALCVGETRVRFDLQAPLRPFVKRSHGEKSGKISVSPTKLRFLSQVWSLAVSQSLAKLIWGQHLISCVLFSAAVIPHQLDQRNGTEHSTVRVSMAHDYHRDHLVT